MALHSTSIDPVAVAVLEAPSERLQVVHTEPDARERMSQLVALAFDRCPAPLVARALGRSESAVYSYRHAATQGLRAYDLLLAPRPFAVSVLRGMLRVVDPGATCGYPSASSYVHALCTVAALCATMAREDVSQLTDEQLAERQRQTETAAVELERVRWQLDEEARKRGLRRTAAGKKKGAK